MLYQNTRQLYTQTQHNTRLNYMGVLTQSGGKKSWIGKLPEPKDTFFCNISSPFVNALWNAFFEGSFYR